MVNCTAIPKAPYSYILILIVGAFSIFGYAPFNYYFVPILSLLVFLLICQKNKQNIYLSSLFYGFGFFLGGLYWIYICLNTYGQMPSILAIIATLLFCIFLSFFFISLKSFNHKYAIVLFPAIFTIIEWIRSFIFTGFPWLSFGYSQVEKSPLSGYLPIIGIHGITFLILFTVIVLFKTISIDDKKTKLLFALLVIFLWLTGHIFKKIEWTNQIEKPISLSLLQGNISQDQKWDKANISSSLSKYLSMIESSDASLIILPETSIPIIKSQLPNYFKDRISKHAQKINGNIIYGIIEEENGKYFNSAISEGVDGSQKYRKFHLVPFGEFIPFKVFFKYIYQHWLNIPFSDLSRGSIPQKPITIGDSKIAINICYEDVFGNEIIKTLPEANILVNISNDAWYGESIASQQHLQISQARAIETGRMMIRSTNTGATAIINPKGRVISQFPLFEKGILHGYAYGFEGTTPYVKYGNFPIIFFSWVIVIFCLLRRKKIADNKV